MRWLYPQNYAISEDKWVKMRDGIKDYIEKQEGEVELFNPFGWCGFCAETLSIEIDKSCILPSDPDCRVCPLYKDKICSSNQDNSTVFWKLVLAMTNNKYNMALVYTNRMLIEIRKHEPMNWKREKQSINKSQDKSQVNIEGEAKGVVESC
jgi:hypothetical protein